MYTYHCHNTQHVHLSLSQYTTCTRTTVTIQNMYTYHCHSTKYVHVPLSQYKTCTLITVTIQNMYTYHCHNTQHVHVPLSQYNTCTHITVRIRTMSRTSGTANINGYFQHTGLLGCVAGWQVLTQTCQPLRQQFCGNLTFRSYNFSNLTQLYDRAESVFIFSQWNIILVYAS